VNNEVHVFVVKEQGTARLLNSCRFAELSGLMHDAGYVPCTRFVLHVVEEEELVFQLCHGSQKLAIAFGLINTAPSSPL